MIRSLYTDNPNHEPSLLMMNSGNMQPICPSLGSWLSYGLGSENQNLPGFVVLYSRPTDERFESIEEVLRHCQSRRQSSTDRWQLPQTFRPSADGIAWFSRSETTGRST